MRNQHAFIFQSLFLDQTKIWYMDHNLAMQPLQKKEMKAFAWEIDCSDLSTIEYREKFALLDNCGLILHVQER